MLDDYSGHRHSSIQEHNLTHRLRKVFGIAENRSLLHVEDTSSSTAARSRETKKNSPLASERTLSARFCRTRRPPTQRGSASLNFPGAPILSKTRSNNSIQFPI